MPLAQADGTFKPRPAVALPQLPGFGDWLVCGIRTQLHHAAAGFDETIDAGDADFAASGLVRPSLIRLGFIQAVPARKIMGRIGSLSRDRHRRLLASLSQLRISAKSDTRFGKYSDSRFGLNSDTFRSGATPERDSYSTVRIEVKGSAAEEIIGAEGDARLSEGGERAAWAVPKRGSAAADQAVRALARGLQRAPGSRLGAAQAAVEWSGGGRELGFIRRSGWATGLD